MHPVSAIQLRSWIFAYKRLTQSLNRSLSLFNGFLREELDPAVKTDICAPDVDDIGITAHTAEKLFKKIEHVFQGNVLAPLKLSMNKHTLGKDELDFLQKTISRQRIALLREKN